MLNDISDPSDPFLGRFNWVIFGSLMTPIRDLTRALVNLRALTKGRAVIISSSLRGDESKSLHWLQTPRPFDWWISTKLLIQDKSHSVGFSRVEETGDLTLVHRGSSQHVQAACHAFP